MTFQSENEIFEVITTNPAKTLLSVEKDINTELVRYVTGEKLVDNLEMMPFFLRDELDKLRKKLTRSTRELFDQLLQPVEKVFTAEGGYRMYNLPDRQEEQFDKILMNVRKGLSMRQWVKEMAFRAYLLDPMSLLFTEYDKDGNAYPTYKSTTDIYDYQLSGRQPEYVVFKLSKGDVAMLVKKGRFTSPATDEEVYRVIDDSRYYFILKKAEGFTLLYQYPNPFGRVPGQIASDIMVFNSSRFESPLTPVMELVKDYFNDNSSKSLFKKIQMHWKEYGPWVACKSCDGVGKKDGEDCEKCKGTGNYNNVKVSERLTYEVTEEGASKIPLPPGGFYGPPIDPWNMMNQELDRIKQEIHDTFWEAGKVRRTQGPEVQDGNITTATGEVINERLKIPKLRKLSEWAQIADKFQTDNIKIIRFSSKTESTIVYGDRYILGTPEELMEVYENLRAKGAPIPALDRALKDVNEAKYATNPLELRRAEILMKVEPFVHFNIEKVMAWPVPDEQKAMKIYFSEWLSLTNSAEIIAKGEIWCKQELAKHANTLGVAKPEADNEGRGGIGFKSH